MTTATVATGARLGATSVALAAGAAGAGVTLVDGVAIGPAVIATGESVDDSGAGGSVAGG